VDAVMLDCHPQTATGKKKEQLEKLKTAILLLSEVKPEINVLDLDDESYRHINPHFPKCK